MRNARSETRRLGAMTPIPEIQVFLDHPLSKGERVEFDWMPGANTGPGGTGNRVRESSLEDGGEPGLGSLQGDSRGAARAPMDPSVEGLFPILVPGLLASVLLWSGLTAVTMVGRLGFERRRRSTEAFTPVMLSGGSKRMVRRATRHRTEAGKWRRAAALKMLLASGHPRGRALVRHAVSDPDPDIAGAAVKALGDLDTPWAGEQLIAALQGGRYQRSRIAAQLERRTPELGLSLVPLLDDPEPVVRFWGATLLGRCPGVAVEALTGLTRDPDANVRCAAIESLSIRRDVAALGTIRDRLYDEAWFVRVHACRAVGVLGTIEEAPVLATSLANPWWWVRSAAKDALCNFGLPVAGVVIPYLENEDEFARNGAAEVLQNVGFLDSLATTGSDGRLRERIFTAGGPALRDAARIRAAYEADDVASERRRQGCVRMNAEAILRWIVVICFAYLALVYVSYFALAVVGLIENTTRRRESAAEDYDTLATSRFTIPVSVVLAAYNEESAITPTVLSLLAQTYPEFEVIVVNDGSSDGTLACLVREFTLQPYEVFTKRFVQTEPIRAVYRSSTFPNLVVIDKDNGGKADALNAGLNAARFRYICGVDADTVFSKDALLKGMRLVMTDPAHVIGVTSHLSIALDPSKAMADPVGGAGFGKVAPRLPAPRLPARILQQPARLVATRLHALRGRRIPDLAPRCDRRGGGFALGFTCEDIELTFRVHERYLRGGKRYQILCLPDNVGTTEGPDTVRKLVAQRERWQRVINESVWHYRRMLFNRRYKQVGMLGMPYYLLSEVLAPLFELLAFASLLLAVGLASSTGRHSFSPSRCCRSSMDR